jgi:uncharacterized beta-barrel protein YwiB (DUF1934 family)
LSDLSSGSVSPAPAGKRPVTLKIHSIAEGQEPIVQQLTGDMYAKGDHWYLRYQEPGSELGRTATTVRIDREHIRVIRQGDVRSEQIFALHGQRHGYYDTPQGKLELTTDTVSLQVALDAEIGHGTVSWEYDLTVSGDPAGRYRLRIDIAAGSNGASSY